MWIVTDYAMNKLLNGCFDLVISAVKKNKTMNIKDLYKLQAEYESYNGFRKFFNKKLRPISHDIKHIDNKFISKLISFIGR